MRAFTCPECRHLVVFESLECLFSDTTLAFDWRTREIVSLGAGVACANRALSSCNGLAGPSGYCRSCALTRTRPADGDQDGLRWFIEAESAKRRLLFELLELGLPVVGYRERPGGLAFDMLNGQVGPVTTGHDGGVITLDLAEADDAHREQLRTQLREPYRTLLGHLRHEIAHYYEPILCPPGSAERARYRELFGDERADYEAALEQHYKHGAPDDWSAGFVSAYATMHPFEDWAETFAHYLHIRDTLQTAVAYGVAVSGPTVFNVDDAPLYSFPAAGAAGIKGLLDTWIPMTYALNALNRSMGSEDLYPFVIPPPVIDKLGFIHALIASSSARAERASTAAVSA
ncbi:MAG: putative zinc-binding metallopeptidase [Solirubrobacteraceae bacterium]|jgi:hypothetical protein